MVCDDPNLKENGADVQTTPGNKRGEIQKTRGNLLEQILLNYYNFLFFSAENSAISRI